MFSSRTRWDLRPNRLSRLLAQKRRRGARVLDLTESNPTRVGLAVPDDLLAPLGSAAGRIYEPAPLGLSTAREAVARDFARRGLPVSADRVVLTASTSEAYAFLFKLLCDPGDEVLVPRPGYPLFEYLATLESVQVGGYPLEYDDRWHVRLDTLRETLSPRTRAVVIVSPGNPSGAYLHEDEGEGLVELASERGLALISDEVFADFSFQGRPGPSLARDDAALAFTLGGLSKSCGLPQVKLAWTAVTGPEEARREALGRLEVIADTALSVSTPVQQAAPSLLARLPELQAPLKERLESNLRTLRASLPSDSPASLLEPEGGWSVVLRVPATLSEEDRAVRLLQDHDVLVHPGHLFDFPRGAHLVLSLLPPTEVFEEGVDRVLHDLVP